MLKFVLLVALVLIAVPVAIFVATREDDGPSLTAAPVDSAPAPTAQGTGAAFADETNPRALSGPSDLAARPAPKPDPKPKPKPEPPAPSPPEQPQTASPFGSEPSLVVTVRRGEEVELLDEPGGQVVAEQGDETEFGSPTTFWVRERAPGWLGVSTPELPNGEIGWVREDASLLSGGLVTHSVLVDLSTRTATLFYEGREMRSWPVTIGAPGAETPIGRFAITDTFEGGLNPAYGCCALAISATQPDLPSGWLGGNRIAFHGTGGPLGVAASSGCVRSADRDVRAMLRAAPLGTPVAIRQ
jgi:hypothetical protein